MTNKPTNKSVQTQEQAIQEAKDRVAKKYTTTRNHQLQDWEDAINCYCQGYLRQDIFEKIINESMLEYSSSQLEAKDKEIEELKDFNSNALNEIGKLGAQLQQATASSGERAALENGQEMKETDMTLNQFKPK